MQILVVSDSHGDFNTLNKLIRTKPKAEVVIFCGDGVEDFMEVKKNYPDKMFIGVRGNCDWGSQLPNIEIVTIAGKKIYITHGHIQNVKYYLDGLKNAAREQNADIALYGHTHEANIEHDDGLWIMNPGCVHRSERSYGLIDIQNGEILMNTAIFPL